MEKIYSSRDYFGDRQVSVDFEILRDVEAVSLEELRLKIKETVLGQLETLVDNILFENFEECFKTKAGQVLNHRSIEYLEKLPAEYGAFICSNWSGTHGSEVYALYHVPSGSTLPEGEKIHEGELREFCRYTQKKAEELATFFMNKQNTLNWVTVYDFG